MRWDRATNVEDVVWNMRLADLPRSENRAIILRQFNGDPPFDPDFCEENQIQVNRNFLEGVNLMSQARRQWNQAFLKPGNYFSVDVDAGTSKRGREWSNTITKHANRLLKKDRKMLQQIRATGANAMLHGIGPCTWDTKQSVVPRPLALSSVLIPSETSIDFDNLSQVAFFREWTPAQLHRLVTGPKRDPGWQMDLVKSQMNYVLKQVMKQPNATAYQYMPERIEELAKQDLGLWASDAVPTIDVWDFFFRMDDGWGRRVILDWGPIDGLESGKDAPRPRYKNDDFNKEDHTFMYTSKNRKYCNSIDEILHCQFADTSCYAPPNYHDVRSLGWMLWGLCDIQNRLHCKFTESVFEQLMWFFRSAGDADFTRLKRADFYHLGVIPHGIDWVKAGDRYEPPAQLIEMAFQRGKQLMSENASAFTQDFDKGPTGREMTATETMARVNQVNGLVSGMLSLAYTYENFKYHEIARRLCIPRNEDSIAKKFRELCYKDGVPSKMLDVDRWNIEPERVLGAGNKTLEMAQAQFLLSVRKNLNPDAQREIDHIAIEANTDDPALAERLAPLGGQKQVSDSIHDAQLATERLMRGLPIALPADIVPEDYVKVWMADLSLMVNQAQQMGGTATMQEIQGWSTISTQVKQLLARMGQDPEEKPKVKSYAQGLGKIDNLIKAFAQRLQQSMKAQQTNGAQNGVKPQDIVQAQFDQAKSAQKLKQMSQSHAAKTAQRQVQFELEQQREDRRTNAAIRRENAKAHHERVNSRIDSLASLSEPTEPETTIE